MITTTLTSSCQWKTLVPFCLWKKKTWKSIFNTNNELLQHCTEKQVMPFKTTVNWLFNDVWRHLVIGCFDWKIGIFQQTVVRVYYILNFFTMSFYTRVLLFKKQKMAIWHRWVNDENNEAHAYKLILVDFQGNENYRNKQRTH